MQKVLTAMRLIFLIAVALVLAGLVPQMASAETYGDFQYSIDGSNATITGYTGPGGDITIPATIDDGVNNYTVTRIGFLAFQNNTTFNSVIIPDSVITIDDGAFVSSTNMQSVSIGNGVTSIGNGAFGSCSNLTEVTIGSNVTYIDYYAFWQCTSLKNMDIPDNVLNVGAYVFQNCSSLTDVTIGDGLTGISSYMFAGCSSLSNIDIGAGVNGIGDYAFSGCTSLESITIPDNVASLGTAAFSDSGLTNLDLGDNVITLGDFMCANCSNLKNVTIGDGVINVPYHTFLYCYSLQNVTIGANVNSIESGAFSNCGSLTTITIPSSVTNISAGAFVNCGLTAVAIPDTVTNMGYGPYSGVFSGCSNLTNVSIGKGIDQIGDEAFRGCSSLTSITIPDNISRVGASAFENCSSLTEAIFLGDAPAMDARAFENCASGFTIYFLKGKTGYSHLWHGYPTAPFEGDTRSMAITNSTPLADEIGIPLDLTVMITFNHDIEASNNYTEISIEDKNSGLVETTPSIEGDALLVDPTVDLTNGMTYFVNIPLDCVIGGDGTPLDLGYNFKFTAGQPAALAVTGTDPNSGDKNVPIDKTITISFSENIYDRWINDIYLMDNSNWSFVDISRNIVDDQLIIDPLSDLTYGVNYTVHIPSGSLQTISGTSLSDDYSFSFIVGSVPEVIGSDPEPEATGVPIDQTVAIQFSEEVSLGGNLSEILITDISGLQVAMNPSATGDTLWLDPVNNLDYAMTYTASIPYGAVKNLYGVYLKSPYSFSFTVQTTVEAIDEMIAYIEDLPSSAVKAPAAQTRAALANKLQVVRGMLDKGNYKGAIQMLSKDIRAKADGTKGGQPHDDWVVTPAEQEQFCLMLDNLLDYLKLR